MYSATVERGKATILGLEQQIFDLKQQVAQSEESEAAVKSRADLLGEKK